MTRPLLRWSWLACISVAMLGRAAATPTRPVLLTGEVVASDSQTIFVPPSNNSPVLLRNFVAEGSTVKKGDLVLRIEAKEADTLTRLEIELEQAKARTTREVADLIVKAIESEQALLMGEAALLKAQVDAAIPKEHLSALDYDRYQGERARTELDLQLKTKATVNANEAVARRRADGELEAKKLLFNLLFLKSQLAEAEVRATRDGLVVHGYSEWRGERCDEGTSAAPGNTAGHILGSGQMRGSAFPVGRASGTTGIRCASQRVDDRSDRTHCGRSAVAYRVG
jgi:multidrug efflux pump subunit AcrA (membrane-fusion protein)